MAVNLKKGQRVNLKKSEFDLSRVTIGLGWDIAAPTGFLKKLVGKEEEYDLDAIAFLLGPSGKVEELGPVENGRRTMVGGDIVFYNSMRHNSGCIWLTGDNRTGAGDGDDEQIVCELERLPAHYNRIVFVVQIYQGEQKKQSFGNVANAFIRAVDARDREMCRFDLSGDASSAGMRSVHFAELTRSGTEWTFTAVGRPHPSDSFVALLKEFL